MPPLIHFAEPEKVYPNLVRLLRIFFTWKHPRMLKVRPSTSEDKWAWPTNAGELEQTLAEAQLSDTELNAFALEELAIDYGPFEVLRLLNPDLNAIRLFLGRVTGRWAEHYYQDVADMKNYYKK